MKVWLDGLLVDAREARIDPADRGFCFADGLYECMRARAGKALRVAAHLARLHAGAGALGLSIPMSDKDIGEALSTTLAANGLAHGTLRLILTRGTGPAAITLATAKAGRPTMMIVALPAVPEPPPAKAIIATVTRRNEFSPTARFKTLNSLDNVLARREAEQLKADDALLLNSQERLADSTVANLFVVIDGDVLTPPVTEGALPGVMRAEVIDRLGAATAQLNPADLASASEAFLTNANGIRALVSVDGKPIGNGREGLITTRLKAAVD
jgi:branched-chain amino acid aminotransferase